MRQCIPCLGYASFNHSSCFDKASSCGEGFFGEGHQCKKCQNSTFSSLNKTTCVERLQCDNGTIALLNSCTICPPGTLADGCQACFLRRKMRGRKLSR